MRIFSVFLILFVPTICFAQLNATCVFDAYTSVYSEVEKEPVSTNIAQTMALKDGITTPETLSLDGKIRATNSKQWKLVEGNSPNSSKSHFIGNAGELLTIFHEVGEHSKGLSGSYKASMAESGFYQSGIRYGQCKIN